LPKLRRALTITVAMALTAFSATPATCAQPPGDVAAPQADRVPDSAVDLPGYLEHYSRPFRIDPDEFKFTQKYYWHRLFHPTLSDKVWGAGVLIASFTLATQKNRIQADVAEDDSPSRERFFRRAQDLGGRGIVPAIAALFYLGGSAFHDYRAKETGFMLAESGILTGILTVSGMWVLSEDRPREGGRLHPFKGIGHGVSGHAATAASISGVLSRMYFQVEPDDGRVARTFKWIGKGFVYAAPVAVSFGRVNEQEHFVYSTILGMAIGFWTSNAVADAHGLYLQAPGSRLKPSGVAPIVGDRGGAGAVVRWEF